MPNCPSCGRRTGPGSHHCLYCGAEIAGTPAAEAAGPSRPPRRRTRGHIKSGTSVGQLVSGVVLAVVALLVVLFLMGICGPD